MGRSQESFNKKEKEKQRQKKRKEKLERKEERKSASSDKKSLDDMIAYVDENGNITSTPPDPKNKKVIKKEDIQIGVARQEDPDPADLIRQGIVAFFNESKGYGFIRDIETRESVFVHINSLSEPVQENDKVTFEVEKGPKGLNAVRVKLIRK
jgi:cold shock CspA family protein